MLQDLVNQKRAACAGLQVRNFELPRRSGSEGWRAGRACGAIFRPRCIRRPQPAHRQSATTIDGDHLSRSIHGELAGVEPGRRRRDPSAAKPTLGHSWGEVHDSRRTEAVNRTLTRPSGSQFQSSSLQGGEPVRSGASGRCTIGKGDGRRTVVAMAVDDLRVVAADAASPS